MSQYIGLGLTRAEATARLIAEIKAKEVDKTKAMALTASLEHAAKVRAAQLALASDKTPQNNGLFPDVLSENNGISPVMIAGGVAIAGVALLILTRKKK